MQQSSLPESWDLDKVLDDLNESGFAVIDNVYSAAYVNS